MNWIFYLLGLENKQKRRDNNIFGSGEGYFKLMSLISNS